MPEIKRKLLGSGIALIAAAAILLATCDSALPPTINNTLERSVGPEPDTLDPHAAKTTQAFIVLRDLGEGLFGYTASGELIPAAAERFEVSEDGLEYRFWLRPEARWSNGSPVIAEHFVAGWRRLVDPQTASSYALHLIDVENVEEISKGKLPPDSIGIVATGEHELTVRLTRPVPYFPSLLVHNSTFPVYPPSLKQHGDGFARAGALVSNGAYKLDSWEVGSVITLSRNEYYWNNAETAIDTVRHLVIPDSSAELNRYLAGELDITDTIPTSEFEILKKERPDELRLAPRLDVYFLGFNLTKPPFKDNPKLRQALSMAIDRDVITGVVTGRGEPPAYGWVPPGVNNYGGMQFNYAVQSQAEREATAKRLYREAGYGPDNPLKFSYRYNTSDTHKAIAEALQSKWQKVLGAEVELINVDFSTLIEQILAREVTQVFRASWNGDYNDANAYMSVLRSGHPSNLPGYSSEKFDSLVAQAATQTDPVARRLYLEEAELKMLADHPLMPLYFYVSKHLVRPRVAGWQDNVMDYHYSQHLSLIPGEQDQGP